MYLGIPSITKDTDKRRRSLYGKAGCFRLKPYGLEYRVLSSAMMKDTQTLSFVWRQLMRAIAACNHDVDLLDSDLVVSTINNSDIETAKKLINKFNLLCAD